MSEPRRPLLNAEQVGDLLERSASWVLAEVRAGRMPHIPIGKKYVRFSYEDVVGYDTTAADDPMNAPAPPYVATASGDLRTYIYFVQSKDGGPVKIGQSVHPRKRLKGLQSGSPTRLVIRRVVWAHPELERALHVAFWNNRLEGEWFEFTPSLRRIVENEYDDRLIQILPQWAVDFLHPKDA